MYKVLKRWFLLAATVVALIISGCTSAPEKVSKPGGDSTAQNQGQVLAKMGSVQLTEDYLRNLLADMNPADKKRVIENPQLAEKVISEEVVKFYFLDLSKRTGWSQRPEVIRGAEHSANQSIVNSFLNSKGALKNSFPDEALIQKSYAANRDTLRQADQVRLAQIFITGQNQADREKIKIIYQRVANQPEQFASLAKQYSEHKSSAEIGGDLGWKSQNVLLPGLAEVVIRMQPGEISVPIQTREGLHILKLLERKPGEMLTLEQARPYIVNQLRVEEAKRKEQQYLQNVLKNNPVTVETEALKRFLKEK